MLAREMYELAVKNKYKGVDRELNELVTQIKMEANDGNFSTYIHKKIRPEVWKELVDMGFHVWSLGDEENLLITWNDPPLLSDENR